MGFNRAGADYLRGMKQIALAIALAPALILFTPVAWAAEKLPLAAISEYLNGLVTAKATFSQINDDSSRSTGTLYLHRPGRMRFEYDPPERLVVVAGSGTIIIYDPKSNQQPETYPLRRTPLSVILARKVDLERADMVVGHWFDGTLTVVTAQDPDNPEYGSIDLMFSDNPVELRRWVIRDASGGQTTVVLDQLQTGIKLSSMLFSTRPRTSGGDR
jgi:outer membrane lipoprotein-sorting protein